MKAPSAPKTIGTLFFGILIFYLASFYGCEYLRHRRGPWQVRFSTDAAGTPALEISQPSLRISQVKLLLAGEKAPLTGTVYPVTFDAPRRSVPFGKVLYDDLTFLPGVVTLDCFGHEIELLPRALVINRREIPWQSGSVLELTASNKPTTPLPPPTKPRRR